MYYYASARALVALRFFVVWLFILMLHSILSSAVLYLRMVAWLISLFAQLDSPFQTDVCDQYERLWNNLNEQNHVIWCGSQVDINLTFTTLLIMAVQNNNLVKGQIILCWHFFCWELYCKDSFLSYFVFPMIFGSNFCLILMKPHHFQCF